MARKRKVTQPEVDLSDQVSYELFSLNDFITQYGSGASLNDISLKDIYGYLKNPYKNLKNVINTSKYLTNKYGLVRDILLAYSQLPTLNYHLAWSSFDDVKKVKKYEKKVFELLNSIDPKRMVRQGIYEQGEVGTVVTCLRNNKYVQFLEIDNLRINRQVNGKWLVEFDLDTIRTTQRLDRTLTLDAIIESLPPEITRAKYDAYTQGKGSRFVELSNCHVLPIRANRNVPFGLPIVLSAIASLVQKDLMDKVERSNADILIKKILILYAGSITGTKETYKPPGKQVIEHYFTNLKNLLQKRDKDGQTSESGIGALTLPDYFKLEPLNVDIGVLTKDLYEKIENDIFMSMGFPKSLVYGSGNSNSFGTESLAVAKVFRYINSLLEDWESVINDYIRTVLPVGLECKFFFDKTTILDVDKDIKAKQDLYMQTGLITPWLEAVIGQPYHYIVGLKEYEEKVLGLGDIFAPPANAFTQSGNDSGGRPNAPDDTDGNMKAKGADSNNQPSIK